MVPLNHMDMWIIGRGGIMGCPIMKIISTVRCSKNSPRQISYPIPIPAIHI